MKNDQNKIFNQGIKWWRGKYELIEEKDQILITVKKETKIEWYNPIEYMDEKPTKQLQRDDEDNYAFAPHIHLANLDISDYDEILTFVNKWGLLGLWEVANYKDKGPFLAPEKEIINPPLGKSYSSWYRIPNYKDQSNSYLHSFCEPVELFQEAVREYQEICTKIDKVSDSPELADEIERKIRLENANLIPKYKQETWESWWQCSSLLEYIHLLTHLNLIQGSKFKICARDNCDRFFCPTNPRRKYCSIQCKNAQNKANQRKRENNM